MVVEKTEGRYPCMMDDPFGEGPARFDRVRGSSYGETPPPVMPAPHVQRMKEEVEGLLLRLRNLSEFIDTKTFNELSELDQRLLREQRNSMIEYARTLSLRYSMASLPE